jgi:hypothetical protein
MYDPNIPSFIGTSSSDWTFLGALGGGTKVFVQLLSMNKLPSKTHILWLLMANAFVSGFSGFMGAVIISQITPKDDLHIISAGISGYLGVAALDLFSEWFKKKIK